MPDTGVLRLLTSEQRATGWRRQLEVEKSLGLEKGAISSYFEQGSPSAAVPETSGVIAGDFCTAGILDEIMF